MKDDRYEKLVKKIKSLSNRLNKAEDLLEDTAIQTAKHRRAFLRISGNYEEADKVVIPEKKIKKKK